MRHLLGIVLFALLPLVAGGKARFLAPHESSVPLVQRDLLPLETDSIRELSQHLALLASGPLDDKDAAQNRAVAQLLALALQLDPVNQAARRLLKQHQNGLVPASLPPKRQQGSLATVQDITRWLLSPASGNAGRGLGLLVLDPLRTLHPDLAICQEAGPEGEAERWQGVIPPITAFLVRPDPEPSIPASLPNETPEAVPVPPTLPTVEPLREAQIRTALFTKTTTGTLGHFLFPITLDLASGPSAPREGLQLRLLPRSSDPLAKVFRDRTLAALLAQWEGPPPQGLATIQAGSSLYFSKNENALTGPTALLLLSSFSGKALIPNLAFLGEVDAKGKLHLPRLGWDYLRDAFNSAFPGKGRLLVPADAEAQIIALLTLGRPGFFLDWEVLAVTDLSQALAHASAHGGSKDLQEATELFREFQKIAKNKPLGPLSVNPHVRKHLQEILLLAPNHLSAKMILLQGSGKRPSSLDDKTLGLELRACLEIIKIPLVATDANQLIPATLESLEADSLKRLATLEKYVEIKHRALVGRVLYSTKRLGQLARARKQAETSALHNKRLKDGFLALREEYLELNAGIHLLLGSEAVPLIFPSPPP